MYMLNILHSVYILDIVLHLGYGQRASSWARGQYICNRCRIALCTIKDIAINNLFHSS